jgi:hypothetical protein
MQRIGLVPRVLVLILPISIVFTSSIGLAAKAAPAAPAPMPRSTAFIRPLGVGFVAGYVDYKEPGLMREYGPLYGVNVSYWRFNQFGTTLYNVEGEIVGGGLLYDGGSMGGARYTKPTSDYILNLRATVGAYRPLTTDLSITPFIGLGLRDLNDKIEGSGSYNRNISYLYVPLGGSVAGQIDRTWSFSFTGDFDIMLAGTVVSKLSDADPSYPDVTNHNHGIGFRLSAALKKEFGRFAVHVAPFYQKWKIQQSDGVFVTIDGDPGVLAEPENESDFVGLNLGADF